MNFDWQALVVAIVVIVAIVHAIRVLCLGNKSKCDNCANKCNDAETDSKVFWMKKE